MIDWAQLHPETQHPLPRAINNARTRQIPSLPSWVHPVDIISFWNPTKGLTDSTSLNASHTWLSDIKKRMGNPTLSTRPGQLPLLPFNLRQAMMELGPIVGGKWRQYPTREQQMEMLERYGLAEMDIARSDDDEVLPILANDQKLRHWAQKQKKPAGQSVTQHDFAGSSDRPSTPKDRVSLFEQCFSSGLEQYPLLDLSTDISSFFCVLRESFQTQASDHDQVHPSTLRVRESESDWNRTLMQPNLLERAIRLLI